MRAGFLAVVLAVALAPMAGATDRSGPDAAIVLAQAAPAASLSTTKPSFSAIERIGVALDARPLRNGSSHRLIVVAADTPDQIGDVNAFAIASTRVTPALLRLTLPPGPAGRDQVRLLYIPSGQSNYVVAARAPVEVAAGTPGARIAYDVTREARALGPVRFEARHRDQPFVLEGQFLRIETRTTGLDWAKVIRGTYKGPQDYMAMYIGHLGTEKRAGEGPFEVLCLMDAGDRANVQQAASLNPGDRVLLRGQATTWGRVYESEAVIFDRCGFGK
jgi:hypothetical protein